MRAIEQDAAALLVAAPFAGFGPALELSLGLAITGVPRWACQLRALRGPARGQLHELRSWAMAWADDLPGRLIEEFDEPDIR
ncbi:MULTISPECIES: hypothetical protein [unclassified Streptomyces]|uniref:hypothetical protein n=1 Tax=unclassified Streptomyces TaxID=2593676 RepID=UPI0027870D4B|nr:hypothetical protein [Streptomyces sp. B4I13]MDQ0958641.1 hypothetical protein [Streptomyces sp. B4I13]